MGAGGVAQLAIVISAVDKFSTTFNRLSAKTTTLQGKMMAFRDSMKAIMPQIGMYAVMMAGQFIKSAVEISTEFDHSLHKVQALSGATGDEMEALEEKILRLGETTMFTSSEVAQAFSNMAMAGMQSAEMIAASSDIINLATAAIMDISDATMIALDVAAPFGIAYENMGRITDTLTTVFTNTKTSLSDLGETMKYVSSIAATAGYTMEETAALVGTLAQAGIRGSMAGTGLRMAIRNLLDPSDEARNVLEELGVTVMDSSGNLNSMITIIDDLSAAGATATNYMQIFGARSGAAMLALARIGTEHTKELMETIEESGGVTKKVADIMESSFFGQMKIWEAAIERVKIELGNAFMPVLIEMTYMLRDDFLPIIKEMAPALARIMKAFMRIAEVLLRALVPVLTVLVPVIEAFAFVIIKVLDFLLLFPGLIETIVALWIMYKVALMICTVRTVIATKVALSHAGALWATTRAEKAHARAVTRSTLALIAENSAIKRATLQVKLATVQQWFWNASIGACPLFAIVTALLLVVSTILIMLGAMGKLGSAFEGLSNKIGECGEAFTNWAHDAKKHLGAVGDALGGIYDAITGITKTVKESKGGALVFGSEEEYLKYEQSVMYQKGYVKAKVGGEDYWVNADTGDEIRVATFQSGTGMGGVRKSGLYNLEEGEIVLDQQDSEGMRSGGGGGGGVGRVEINVYPSAGMNEHDIAVLVEERLRRLLLNAEVEGYG